MHLLNMDWIGFHAARTPQRVALEDLGSGRRFTYAESAARILALTAGLAAAFGVRSGDRVAAFAAGTTDIFELQFACMRLGAALVPLHGRSRPEELAGTIRRLEPRVLCLDGDADTQIAGEERSIPLLRLGPGGEYEALIAGHAGSPGTARTPLADADAVSTILFTSGTTSRPKGVLLTNRMTSANAENMALAAGIDAGRTHICVLPLYHSAGLNLYANPVLRMGGRVLVAPRFDPGEVIAMLGDADRDITHFFGVPTNYAMLAEHPDFARADFSRLGTAGVGGAPVAETLVRACAARGLRLTPGYGMTETGPSLFVMRTDDVERKPRSIGRPLLHVEARLVTPAGIESAPGEPGEIEVRGPTVTPGYWRDETSTASLFRDGWLRTGDVAVIDDEGLWTIIGRRKDMFISGGENVHPAEIEEVLMSHPDVAEAAVVGVPHDLLGEVGQAFLVPRSGRRLSETDLEDFCLQRLARFKRPRSFVVLPELPRNALGKVDRACLRQHSGRSAGAFDRRQSGQVDR